MEENGYKFSYTGYQEIDENGHETGAKISGPKKIAHGGMVDYCWPGCLTVMYDANVIGLIQIPDKKKNSNYSAGTVMMMLYGVPLTAFSIASNVL